MGLLASNVACFVLFCLNVKRRIRLRYSVDTLKGHACDAQAVQMIQVWSESCSVQTTQKQVGMLSVTFRDPTGGFKVWFVCSQHATSQIYEWSVVWSWSVASIGITQLPSPNKTLWKVFVSGVLVICLVLWK